MDIVDSQVHLAFGKIESTLDAMDALGVKSVLIDEFWTANKPVTPPNLPPGYALPNGAWRIVRVDRRDPDLECGLRLIRSAPSARAIRILPGFSVEEATAFAEGAYDSLCEIAQDFGLPVCIFIPGFVESVPRALSKFPRLSIIIDHCGMPIMGISAQLTNRDRIHGPEYFGELLKLAEYPNAALKWGHEQSVFGAPDYPYEPLRPYLRRAINAFGADRLLWASDRTVNTAHSWSDMLHYLRDDPELSRDEKEWILGRSARRVLNWTNDADRGA
jgi:predicted TIM-barrel fold metal-dependent hydrolase